MIEAGTILQNRYRIEKHIGQGGMGKVYVASDERFNSTVAIKETVFEDKNLRRAFEREARLLNSLKHQALPRVSDHFMEGDGQFLVMEYIAGEDLAAMMERDGEAFSLEDVLNWAKQLSDALDYLHSQDIIHRDIKPQNLKLTPSGQIVLLDFGLAKGSPTDAAHHTAAKSIFGYSRSYASLEQIQGTGTEPRSDLYSLGATIYHLLTGIPPADALTRAMNVLNGQPDPLVPAHLINKKVPRGVSQVLQKAMALNANERPVSAHLMQEMLEASDKEIAFDENFIASPSYFTADLLTQETKIKQATTNVPGADLNSPQNPVLDSAVEKNPFKTKLASENSNSKVTEVRPAVGATKPSKRSARAVGAAIFGGLFLAGSALSAAYFLSSENSGNDSNVQTINSNAKTNFVITAPENKDFSKSEPINEAPALAETENASKSPETTKVQVRNTKKQKVASVGGAGQSKKNSVNSEDFVIKGNTIETKGMIIDENGIRMKEPPEGFPKNRVVPPIPPTKYQVLTPEQIRRLEELKNVKPRVIIVNTPTPKPTP